MEIYVILLCVIVSVKCQVDSITVRERFIFLEIGRPYLVEEEVMLHQPYQLRHLKEMIKEAEDQQEGLKETCDKLDSGLKEEKQVKSIEQLGGLSIEQIARFYHPYTNNPTYNDSNLYGLADAKRLCDENGFTLVQPKNQDEFIALTRLLQAYGLVNAVLNVKFDSHRALNRLEDYSEAVMVPSVLYPRIQAISSVGTIPDKHMEDNNAVYLALSNGTLYIDREYHSGPAHASWAEEMLWRNPTLTWAQLMIPKVKGGVVCQLKHQKQYRDIQSQLQAQKEQVKRAKIHCTQLVTEMGENVQYLASHLEQTVTKYGIEYHPTENKERDKRSWGALIRVPSMFRNGRKMIKMAKSARNGYKALKAGRQVSKAVGIDVDIPIPVPNVLQQASSLAETVGEMYKVGKAIYAPLKPLTAGMRRTVLDKSPIRNGLLEQVVKAIQRVNSDFSINSLLTQALSNYQQISRTVYEGIEELDDTIQSLSQKHIPGKFMKGIKKFFAKNIDERTVAQLKDEDPIDVEPEVDANGNIHVTMTFQQGKDIWKMLRIIPTPIFDDDKQELVKVDKEYVLVNMEGSRYIVLSQQEMEKCRDNLCRHSTPIQSIRDDECVLAHYRQERTLAETCEVSITKAHPFFKAVDEGVIYALPINLTISIGCPEQLELSQTQYLSGRGILHIPSGCELISEEPYVRITGPLESSFESTEEGKNHTYWVGLKDKYHRIRLNQTKVTRLQFSQAKEKIQKDIAHTLLIIMIVCACFLSLCILLCVKLIVQNNRINRRKTHENRQQGAHIELRHDFDSFSERMVKLLQAMEREEKRKNICAQGEGTAPLYGTASSKEEIDPYVDINDPEFEKTPVVDELMKSMEVSSLKPNYNTMDTYRQPGCPKGKMKKRKEPKLVKWVRVQSLHRRGPIPPV